eukprot:12707692-Alexandrium_andersonii.AAC.1
MRWPASSSPAASSRGGTTLSEAQTYPPARLFSLASAVCEPVGRAAALARLVSVPPPPPEEASSRWLPREEMRGR